MNAIIRNTRDSKRGKHLLFPFNGNMYVSLKNAKTLCGYSETTGNDVILSKVSDENIVKLLSFNKKGNISETYYLNYVGFIELSKNLTQKDKKQNAKLALTMIQDAIVELRQHENSKKLKMQRNNEPIIYVKEILEIVGPYNIENKQKWIKLYDELDKQLDESIRKTHQRYQRDRGVTLSLLNFIVNETNLGKNLYEVACKLYKK